MTIKSKIAAALAVVTLASSLAIPTSCGPGAATAGASARHRRRRDRRRARLPTARPTAAYYVDGYRRCRWERQYDAYGFYVGTVKVCRVY